MQDSTKTEQSEQSNGQLNTEETPKLEYFNEEIKGAKPLRIVGNDDQGYCIVFGKYRLGEIHKTKEAAEEQIYEEPWQMTIDLIGAIITNLTTQEKLYLKKDTNK